MSGRSPVSIGLAFGLPGQGGAPADLLRLADIVLYEAKAAGRAWTCYAVMGVTTARTVPLTPPRLAMAASGVKHRRSA